MNYQISSAILITSEIKQKLGTNVEKYVLLVDFESNILFSVGVNSLILSYSFGTYF